MIWSDGRYRGYIKLTLERDSARADYVALDTVESPDFAALPLRSVRIRRDGDSLIYA